MDVPNQPTRHNQPECQLSGLPPLTSIEKLYLSFLHKNFRGKIYCEWPLKETIVPFGGFLVKKILTTKLKGSELRVLEVIT